MHWHWMGQQLHLHVSHFKYYLQTLSKITWDRISAVIVIPDRPDQYWHKRLLRMPMEEILYSKNPYISVLQNVTLWLTNNLQKKNTANMVLKLFLQKSIQNKYVSYIKNSGWHKIQKLITLKFSMHFFCEYYIW